MEGKEKLTPFVISKSPSSFVVNMPVDGIGGGEGVCDTGGSSVSSWLVVCLYEGGGNMWSSKVGLDMLGELLISLTFGNVYCLNEKKNRIGKIRFSISLL